MTLAEFNIRDYAYRREQQWSWAKYRLVGYMAIRAFNIAPKSIPKSPKDVIFLPMVDKETSKSGLTSNQLEAFRKAQEEYNNQLKIKEIG